ncbi:hypothetical protein, partial [Pseudomonas aeruginosa]|uniref:hypothetical protein n=5 Tax=Pseudomonas aeruginosa TaxID=287 RepID=UPI001EE172D3
PAPSPTPSPARAFLDNLRFFYSWQFRPLLLGLWFMTADLVCSWATLYRRLLLELLRLLKPVLLWVLRVLLVRLVLMLLMMYLGTEAFRALLL